MDKNEIMKRVDHTLLTQTATWEEIERICSQAIKYSTASVCIPPSYVKRASEKLDRLYEELKKELANHGIVVDDKIEISKYKLQIANY